MVIIVWSGVVIAAISKGVHVRFAMLSELETRIRSTTPSRQNDALPDRGSVLCRTIVEEVCVPHPSPTSTKPCTLIPVKNPRRNRV